MGQCVLEAVIKSLYCINNIIVNSFCVDWQFAQSTNRLCRRFSPLTQWSPLLHVGHQVLHVLGNGFGIEQSRVHPSLAALEDHIHFLSSAYMSAHKHRSRLCRCYGNRNCCFFCWLWGEAKSLHLRCEDSELKWLTPTSCVLFWW